MHVLILNCWTDTILFHSYRCPENRLIDRGTISRIGSESGSFAMESSGEASSESVYLADHAAAFAFLLSRLRKSAADGIDVVAHRVVHGGERFRESVLIDETVMEAIRLAREFAPLHNESNIAGIEATRAALPDVPHVALFDTAFHQTMPQHAYLYPLPLEWYEAYGVRRYGFHGAAHRHLARRGAELAGLPTERCNLITVHFGRGVSLCAIAGGKSIDTSMGMTPLEGGVMDTRCGDIDPGVVTFMMLEENLSARDMEGVLNRKSGMAGITGRHLGRGALDSLAGSGDRRAILAREMEAYRLRKYLGSYVAALGRVDAVVFAGGAPGTVLLREKVLTDPEIFGIILDSGANGADHLPERRISAAGSAIPVFVTPAREELVFLEDVAALLHLG